VIRTVKVKLDVPTERGDDLHQIKNQFLHCANTTAEWAWRHPNGYCVTSKQKAENALYDQLRNEAELTANLVQKGIRRAIEATKSGVARLKRERRPVNRTSTRGALSPTSVQRRSTATTFLSQR
jgi:hypothetical protein